MKALIFIILCGAVVGLAPILPVPAVIGASVAMILIAAA
jgi:hypothetical protein